MRFNQTEFAEFYNRQQISSGYPGRLLPFILGELDGLHSVIDIGSGTGLITIPLISAGYKLTAVEPSMEMISIMENNIPSEYKSSVKIFNGPWENWKGGVHDAAIMIHSLYPMADIKKAIRLMNASAIKKILIVRDSFRMKTLSGLIRERLDLSSNRDLNSDIITHLNSLGVKWKTENIFEERKHLVESVQSETDSVLYQLELADSYRGKITEIITDAISKSGDEIYFNSVFCDNAYIF